MAGQSHSIEMAAAEPPWPLAFELAPRPAEGQLGSRWWPHGACPRAACRSESFASDN